MPKNYLVTLLLLVTINPIKPMEINETNKAIHKRIPSTIETRALHNVFFNQMLNCCTPRDAYFREVVTEGLTVTDNLNISGTFSLGGAIQADSGTVSAPSYSFISSPSTGLYSPGADRFALSAGGTNKINYDGTSVLVTSMHRFSATLSNSQVIPTNTPTTIVFNNVLAATTSYDSTTGIYTVPVSGMYLIAFHLTLSSTAASDQTFVYTALNGSQIGGFRVSTVLSPTVGQPLTVVGSMIMPLNINDTIQVRCNGSTTAGRSITVQGGGNPFGYNTLLAIQLLSVN